MERYMMLFSVIAVVALDTIRGESDTSTLFGGCFVDGFQYKINEVISTEYNEQSNSCTGKVCTYGGEVLVWQKFGCKKIRTSPDTLSSLSTTEATIPTSADTLTKTPTISPSTTEPTITPILCVEIIDTSTTPDTTPDTTTAPPSTPQPPPAPPPSPADTTTTADIIVPYGCVENGIFYHPGSEISKIHDKDSNSCHGSYCDDYGQIMRWFDFNCKKTTVSPSSTTAPTTTALPSTTTDITTKPDTMVKIGCVTNGIVYQSGEKISIEYDEDSNWCYGTFCNDYGQVMRWDDFDCKETTSTPSPTPVSIE